MKTICILVHEKDPFRDQHYLIQQLAEKWCARNFKIEIARNPENLSGADIVIQHLNMTTIPASYTEALDSHPLVINGKIHSISKRTISKNLLKPGCNYLNPVIVKTDNNHGGRPDRRLQKKYDPISMFCRQIKKRCPWQITGILDPENYQIYPKSYMVPHSVWQNNNLVVEKLCTEKEGNLYLLRQWIFFGSKEICRVLLSPNPVIHAGDVVAKRYSTNIPQNLRKARKKFGFDYGKFDFIIRDGKAVLFDTNFTQSFMTTRTSHDLNHALTLLSLGIHDFI